MSAGQNSQLILFLGGVASLVLLLIGVRFGANGVLGLGGTLLALTIAWGFARSTHGRSQDSDGPAVDAKGGDAGD